MMPYAGANEAQASERTIKVGVYNNPPIAYPDKNNKYRGLSVEVLEHIANQEGWALEYVPSTWAENIDRLKKGEIDLLVYIAISEERKKLFNFNNVSLMSNWGVAYSSTANGITSILELDGKKVATLKRGIHTTAISKLIEEFGINVELIKLDTNDDVLGHVESKQADVGIVNRIYGLTKGTNFKVTRTPIVFNPVEIRYAAPKGRNHDLLLSIDTHLRQLKEDKNSIYYRIFENTFSTPVSIFNLKWAWWALSVGGALLLISVSFISVLRIKVRSATTALRKSRLELEIRVEERTKNLTEEILERKRAEGGLARSEERFRDFAEASADWLWETDEDHRLSFISEGIVHGATGLRAKDIVGKRRTDFVKEDVLRYPDKWKKHLADLDAHRPIKNFQYSIMTPKEGMREFAINGKPIFAADGMFKGYRGVASDITERKRAEAQLIQTSKLATLGEMATGMAHELNQPLNITHMAAETLLEMMNDGDVPAEVLTGKLERILDQTDRASAIINHMRIFGRKDSGEQEVVDLKEAALGAAGLVNEQLRLSDIKLSVNLPESYRKVMGQQLQLEQVVLNLLTNARDAIKANEDSGNKLQRIAIGITDDPGSKEVTLTVQDTGGGVPDAVVDHIFEPFFSTKEVGQGTGLGLSISYGMITNMGGRIEVANVDGGAKFTVSLPAANEASRQDSP